MYLTLPARRPILTTMRQSGSSRPYRRGSDAITRLDARQCYRFQRASPIRNSRGRRPGRRRSNMTRMTTRRDALQLFGEIEWFVTPAAMNKLLIANRGEIAVRIIRACREMGISPVAVYSDCDRTALHVRLADEAYAIGPSAPRESYLRIDRILDAAVRSGADALHPGYGFLAENEQFATAVRDAGLTFVGPTPDAVALMGSKTAARTCAIKAGVPVVPGTEEPLKPDATDADIVRGAEEIGYPLLVK